MTNQCKAIKPAAKLVLFIELHKFLWNDYRVPLCFYPLESLDHLVSLYFLEYLESLDFLDHIDRTR